MSFGTFRLGASEAAFGLSLADVKLNLRVEHGLHDVHILSLMASAVALLEKTYGICILRTNCVMVFDCFEDVFTLRRATNMQLDGIKYFDVDGVEQEFGTVGVKLAQDVPSYEYLSLRPTFSWPVHYAQFGEVSVAYVAGWTAAEGLPKNIWQALQMLIGLWFKFSEVAVKEKLNVVPMSVAALMGEFDVI